MLQEKGDFLDNCIICDRTSVRNLYNIYEDEYIFVRHSNLKYPIKGYFYIEFKRHVENWGDLSKQELHEYSEMIQILTGFLTTVLNVERVYTLSISEVVRHLHVHIIPRLKEDEDKGVNLIHKIIERPIETKRDLFGKNEISNVSAMAKEYIISNKKSKI